MNGSKKPGRTGTYNEYVSRFQTKTDVELLIVVKVVRNQLISAGKYYKSVVTQFYFTRLYKGSELKRAMVSAPKSPSLLKVQTNNALRG